MSDTTETQQQVADLIARGRKIEAIKLVRESTGAGLAEARDAVERLAGGGPAADGPAASMRTALPADVCALIDQGERLAAIRALHAHGMCGLREARRRVDIAMGRKAGVGSAVALALLLLGAVVGYLLFR